MPETKLLMHDRFESLRPGAVREAIDGAFREMHAQPASPDDNLGGWSTRAGGWGLMKDPWRVVEADGGRRLESVATAWCADNTSILTGEVDWVSNVVNPRASGDGTVTLCAEMSPDVPGDVQLKPGMASKVWVRAGKTRLLWRLLPFRVFALLEAD